MEPMLDRINAAVKVAMLSKDAVARDCLRTVLSEIKNLSVNANPPREISDELCVKVLQKSAKTHADSIAQFEGAGRTNLVEKERRELSVIEGFLPKMLSEDETRSIVEKVMSDDGIEPVKRNMGLIMKSLPKVDGLDRKLVSKILQGVLK